MKKLLFVLLFIPTLAFAQDEEKKHIQAGVGFSFGFFNPADVNDYIDWRLQGASMETGFSEIIMHFGGKAFVGYRADNNLGIEAFLEGNIAPKILSVSNGEDLNIMLNRVAPGVQLSYDIRLGKKHSIILGAGPTYNMISLRDDGDKVASASAIGGKFTVAYQFSHKHIAPRAFIDIDYAKATDNGIEMNYSGVQIGLAFSGLW